jgi:uncharacterized phiE125 gp8 family phage protein
MNLKLITAPTLEPVTLEEAKSHRRIESSDEDVLIVGFIEAAREWCEGYQNRAFITQTWELALDCFPPEDRIRIPKPPLQSVESIKYYDTDETEHTFSADSYHVDTYSEPGRVVLKYGETWPSDTLRTANGVIIQFTAGYSDTAATVPEKVKQAIKVLVGHLYENREATDIKELKEVPFAVCSLLGLERIWPV